MNIYFVVGCLVHRHGETNIASNRTWTQEYIPSNNIAAPSSSNNVNVEEELINSFANLLPIEIGIFISIFI